MRTWSPSATACSRRRAWGRCVGGAVGIPAAAAHAKVVGLDPHKKAKAIVEVLPRQCQPCEGFAGGYVGVEQLRQKPVASFSALAEEWAPVLAAASPVEIAAFVALLRSRGEAA